MVYKNGNNPVRVEFYCVVNNLSISYQHLEIALQSFVILGEKMEDKKLIIPIEQIKDDFAKFLSPEHNRRIIFSGPFGIGKTYFLNEFFNANKEYFPIFLRPINYSLLSNEDVFRFIKYDILCQLVENEKFDIEDGFDFTEWDYTKLFLGQNGFAILFNLLKFMPKIGAYVKASQKMGILVEKFQEGLKKFNDNKELKLLKEFGEQTENHFLFENDGITEFISQQLEKIVSTQTDGEQKKQKVLIIDDLDRLDPEHIFRLFNVFSAHFDQVHYYDNLTGNDNKFGFDRIIFVCDIENIRKIFAHKYGSEVDFSGYIDKFYSTEIFHLMHKDVFDKYVVPFIEKKIQIKSNDGSSIDISVLLKIALKFLFNGKELNIRILEKIGNYKPSFVKEMGIVKYQPISFTRFGSKEISVLKSYKLLILSMILIDIYSSKEELLRKFRKALLNYSTLDNQEQSYQYNTLLNELLLFADIENHRFQISTNERQNEFNYEPINIKYCLTGGYYNSTYNEGEMYFRANLISSSNKVISNGEFYLVLVNAITNILEKGIV